MIGYKMGSSPAGVYTTAMTSPMEHFKHECQHGNPFLSGNLYESQVCWATLNPLTRNLNSRELQLETFFRFFLPSYPPHQPSPQIALPWGDFLTGRCTSSINRLLISTCFTHRLFYPTNTIKVMGGYGLLYDVTCCVTKI